ncbi:MAG: 5-methylcytosine restriction system specificity protein McrC [Brevinema sp.]
MTQQIFLKDNFKKSLKEFNESENILKKYAHQSLKNLLTEHNGLMIFSPKLDNEDFYKQTLWEIRDSCIHTGNLMGFIGLRDDEGSCAVKISSRFTNNDQNDYFLHYMLQKVFLGQTINLDLGTINQDHFWEYYYYLFPYYLNKALAQGLYKEYVYKKYDNINLRGVIDIKRHINKNVPFQGEIAYNTREHSYNNRIIQLIRHTMEHITRLPFGKTILNSTYELRENIDQIKYLTVDFHQSDKQKLINECDEKISNPYWEDYENLRNLCLKILNQDSLTFKSSDNKVHGILFDGAWLWEEYLATMLIPQGFIHPDNKNFKNAIQLAEEGLRRYPDFYCKDRKIVLDVKYKHPKDDRRDDIHQIVSYMYRLQSEKGILIYPSENLKDERTFHLLGCGASSNTQLIHKIFKIPSNVENYQLFQEQMLLSEQEFLIHVLNYNKNR